MRARDMLQRLVGSSGLVVQWLALGFLLAISACNRNDDSVQTSYYDRKIGVTLLQSCAASPTKSGCHVAADDHGNDVTA